MDSGHFLQELIVSGGVAEAFPQDFPHTICQALAMPLAEPGMLQANITRSVFMFAAAGGEITMIVQLMNSCHEQLPCHKHNSGWSPIMLVGPGVEVESSW